MKDISRKPNEPKVNAPSILVLQPAPSKEPCLSPNISEVAKRAMAVIKNKSLSVEDRYPSNEHQNMGNS